MEVFADNLRRRADELGLSNAEVARRTGLAERRYANYVIGRREPDLATLVRIADTLGMTVDDLLRSTSPARKATVADDLRTRLQLAAKVLDQRDLHSVVVQVEALAAQTKTG